MKAPTPKMMLSIAMLVLGIAPSLARAGGEEGKDKKPKQEQKVPEDTELPKEPETIDPSITEAPEPSPTFTDPEPAPAAPTKKRYMHVEEDMDRNIDYSRILDSVEAMEAPRGVLPPAQGFRGYRPSMVAAGMGDRTPGVGGLVEYSWNRIGWGLFFSYRNNRGEDRFSASWGFAGTYGLYRWLPWDISPYFLLGIEVGSQTPEPFGGLTGLGVEARIYSGWTLLFGWTHHSTVRRGFVGGALGWSF